MTQKRLFIAGVLLVVSSVTLFTNGISLPDEHDFIHQTGRPQAQGWEALFRIHRPGYLVKGFKKTGDRLQEGIYQYRFTFALRPGHLSGLFSRADDVVRLEVADATTGEILLTRTLQMADFPAGRQKLFTKSLTFSALGRAGHHFEPRVYWPGLAGIFLQRIALTSLGNPSPVLLRQKAADLGVLMQSRFIERGFVVVRDSEDGIEDVGDCAMWTGLYAATEALHYKATQDPHALEKMEQSLWALHRLVKASTTHGTMVRYIRVGGKTFEQTASKDTYTGFFYGVAQAFPYVRSPSLKNALTEDIKSLGNYFLQHDLSFALHDDPSLDFNPYVGKTFMTEALSDLRQNSSSRRNMIRALRWVRWYFWIHGQAPPRSFGRLMRELEHPGNDALEREVIPLLNDLRSSLRMIQKNVHRSALRGPQEDLSGAPYTKLDLILLKAMRNLEIDDGNRPIRSLQDLKILPSQSLHALHFIKVAAEMLPKPNRFDRYYRANLYEGKALLRTAVQWHQIDEDATIALFGQTEADTRRTASAHLSYLALHDLILLEKDPLVRFNYQKLFEAQYEPMKSDGNAMIDAMQAAVGLSTKQLGLAWWSLSRYPMDRRGKGDRYWQKNKRKLLEAYGGEVNGQARDPLPPDLRPRDAFLWQRSAHSIRGDQEGWLYPPLDYLFAYWLARTVISVSIPDGSAK